MQHKAKEKKKTLGKWITSLLLQLSTLPEGTTPIVAFKLVSCVRKTICFDVLRWKTQRHTNTLQSNDTQW